LFRRRVCSDCILKNTEIHLRTLHITPSYRNLNTRGDGCTLGKPNLYNYENFREYLKDTYVFQKKETRGFSFRWFSQQADLSSPNYLKLVMEGSRNLTPKTIQKFAKALRLNHEQNKFFENLVLFNQSSSLEDKSHYYEEMKRSHHYREIKELEAEEYEYFSRWYNAAIRELVLLPEFREDPHWIAQKLVPHITYKQAEEALQLLLSLELLKRNSEGKLIQSSPIVSIANGVKSIALLNFHKQMLKRAEESLEKMNPEERDVSSVTIVIPVGDKKRIKKEIVEFRRKLISSIEEINETGGQVCQLNIQLFPLTNMEKKRAN